MSKKLKITNCLILVILLCITSLAGCIGCFVPGEVTYLDIGLQREHVTNILKDDGMFSCGARNKTNVFDESNVAFDFYFGHRKLPTSNSDFVSIIVVFLRTRSAIYAEEHDDYRNIPNFFIAREFTVDEFFSEKYTVKAGEYGTLAYYHHEKFTVPKELYMPPIKISNMFYFAVLSVSYNTETKKYNFLNDDYAIYHLISIRYNKLGDGKIKLSDPGRPLLLEP
ncbi:MAG: hypothetical protein LBE09_08020 [Christensenellaceae bacterium]|jgi:hypothetical protein|nr:hypothetical protein [Christensenellaceae bacterium]